MNKRQASLLRCNGHPSLWHGGGHVQRNSLLRYVQRNSLLRRVQESEEAYAELEDLVRRMLALDPARRISPEDALAHPFIARLDTTRS